jgi:hypothetical protein
MSMPKSRVFPTLASASAMFLPAVCLAIAIVAAGCGNHRNLAFVSGKVTYHGKPLQFGSVMFQPESGQPATAAIQPDGTFTMATRGEGDGASVGKNRVRVSCFESQSPSYKPANGPGELSLGKSLIPQKYSSYETSGITVEVRSGTNEPFIINLTD